MASVERITPKRQALELQAPLVGVQEALHALPSTQKARRFWIAEHHPGTRHAPCACGSVPALELAELS
ncbi:hypothetical protein [Corallococcus sp. EGB]|uniref:hypothetical protein n=1 Tax=Corallococcus sp. EGB TaxID=1521117 RepID=UPI001CBF4F39|nr:hypothetical protein [Corallococcus sp. EGB]